MKRKLYNWWGRIHGFGGCINCGDSWLWKPYHTIRYNEYSSMFPICQECFDELSIQDIMRNVNLLLDKWEIEDREGVYEAVEKEVWRTV